MKRIVITSLLSLICLAETVFATSYYQTQTHLCNLHYSVNAYGKTVESVLVHSGVLAEKGSLTGISSGVFIWQDVQDTELTRDGQAFVGKTVMNSSGGKFRDSVLYPVVQYFVTFTDGSSYISEEFRVFHKEEVDLSRLQESSTEALEKALEEFHSEKQNILETECSLYFKTTIG